MIRLDPLLVSLVDGLPRVRVELDPASVVELRSVAGADLVARVSCN